MNILACRVIGISKSSARRYTSWRAGPLRQCLSQHRAGYINLFDVNLAVVRSVKLSPGARYLFLDIESARRPGPTVLASARKVLGVEDSGGVFRFYAEGPDKTEVVIRVAFSQPPTDVELD